MIFERVAVSGRMATVVYLTDSFEPTPKDTATLSKIIFDDGAVLFATKAKGNPGLRKQ